MTLPLGLFVGNPNGSDSGAMASYEAAFAAFVAKVGQPKTMNAFTDFGQDPSQWASNASWSAWSWSLSKTTAGLIPVVGVPLSSNGAWSPNNLQFFQDIAAGKYDADYTGVATAWLALFPHSKYRLGYEFNGGFMPWFALADSDHIAAFIAAFRHVAGLIRGAVTSGQQADIIWNPASINWTNQPTESAYPGDDVVDIIGLDTYSPCYQQDLQNWNDAPGTMEPDAATWLADPVNRRHFWTRPGATQYQDYGAGYGMEQHLAFAKAHGKPIAICECGAGNSDTSHGPADEPEFAPWLAAQLAAAQAEGIVVDHVNIWATNQSDGAWGFLNGEQPQAAAAWQAAFGTPAAAPAPAPAPASTPPPDAPPPAPAATPSAPPTSAGQAVAVLTDRTGKSVTLTITGPKDFYASDTGLASNVYVYEDQDGTGLIIQPDNTPDLPTIELTPNGMAITPAYFTNVKIDTPAAGPATAAITDRDGNTVTLTISGVKNFYASDTGLLTNIYVYENQAGTGLTISADAPGDAPTIVLTTNGTAIAPSGFANVTVH